MFKGKKKKKEEKTLSIRFTILKGEFHPEAVLAHVVDTFGEVKSFEVYENDHGY